MLGEGGGGGLRCLALTSMSRRLLHRRYDMRGGEGNAAWQRCEESLVVLIVGLTRLSRKSLQAWIPALWGMLV